MEPYIPLMTAILTGVLSGAAAIAVAVIQSRAQHSHMMAEMDKRDALQAQRIEQLEEKMDKHNRMIERTYALEQKVAVHSEQISVANHRICDLEKG